MRAERDAKIQECEEIRAQVTVHKINDNFIQWFTCILISKKRLWVQSSTNCDDDLTFHMYTVGSDSTKNGAIKSKAAKGGWSSLQRGWYCIHGHGMLLSVVKFNQI